jgi:O-antigen ligase
MAPTPAMNLPYPTNPTPARTTVPVALLALMMFLVPALGVPSELMLQDTLKSALVAFGVLAAALVFFWQQRQRTAPLLWHGLVWLPLVLMLYALGSMVWSHTYLAAVEAIRWFVLSLLLWLGLNTLSRREHVMTLAWGIHGGAFIASIWAALQFWFDFNLFPQFAPPASTFVNRNFFAEYAVCALPFSVYVLANLRVSRWLGVMALSVAFNVVALMMTGTRSALIALAVLVPVCLLILVRYRQQFAFTGWSRLHQVLIVGVLAAGVAGLGALPPKQVQAYTGSSAWQQSLARATTLTEITENTEATFAGRIFIWKSTARMILANPLSGVGAGAWEVQIPLYQGANNALEADYYAHNEFLQLLAECGVLVGGLFLAVLFAYLLLAAGKTWRLQDVDLPEAPLRALTLASLLALLIVSNAGFPWRLASTGALFALGLGILAASDARIGFQETFFAAPLHWQPGFSRILLGLLLCCTALAGYITQQATESERKIVRAIQLGNRIIDSHLLGNNETAARKTELLQSVREGLTINPHYRRLVTMVADRLVWAGDWENAVWMSELVAASRPNIANNWANIFLDYLQLGQNNQALIALKQLQRLQPNTPRTRRMEVLLLSRTGHKAQATQMLIEYFKRGEYDFALVKTGYELGLETHNWNLAIQSLELHNKTWPEHAADGYLHLGKIYADPATLDDAKALSSFRSALQAAHSDQKDSLLSQIPEWYRTKL